MQPHPVPKDISSFQFQLVGDMTLKQFAYLAGGCTLAYLAFIFLSKPLPIIAWPIIIFSVSLGSAFAFLPIAERPLDLWLKAYFKAVFSPTQYQYFQPKITPENTQSRLKTYFGTTLTPQTNPKPIITQPIQIVQKAPPIPKPATPQSVIPQAPSPLPSNNELQKAVELAKEAQLIQGEIVKTEQELAQIKAKAVQPGVDPKNFAKEFQKTLGELQKLNAEASDLSSQLAGGSKAVAPITVVKAETVKPVNAPTMALTSIPNIINGIITDSQGNYLDGAIVVAHDKQGIPVRALKSNKLGQFVAATPLPSGTYILDIEKDSLIFDKVEVELKEEILPPMLLTAKKAQV